MLRSTFLSRAAASNFVRPAPLWNRSTNAWTTQGINTPHARVLPALRSFFWFAKKPELVVTLIPPHFDEPNENQTLAILYEGMKEKILKIPNFPTPDSTPSPPVHETRPVPDMGIGTFATKDLIRGDLIMSERPLIVYPSAIKGYKRALDAIDSMHPENVSALKELEDSFVGSLLILDMSLTSATNDMLGILATNSRVMPPAFSDKSSFRVICKESSRINHSCSPNAIALWHPASFTWRIVATNSIARGEEITNTYIDYTLPRSKRQSSLSATKIECKCPTCMLPPELSKSSDRRRDFIRSHRGKEPKADAELIAWMTDPSAPDDQIIKDRMHIIETMEEERCYEMDVWGWCIDHIWRAYCALENEKEARRWAEELRLVGLCGLEDLQWFADEPPQWCKYWGARRIAREAGRWVK